MLDKVNVTRIVVDHIRTLRDNRTGRLSIPDLLLFFLVPGVISGVLLYSYGSLERNLINIVATSLSIFAALLFNLLLIVYDVMAKVEGSNSNDDKLRRQVLREVFSNISFAILVAIWAIVSILVLVLVNGVNEAEYVWSFLISYLVTLFLLTLLMLLKRVHVLLRRETDNP